MQPMQLLPVSLLLAFALASQAPARGFLIVSAPRSSRLSWIEVPADGDFSKLLPRILVDTGLQHPQGVTVDHRRQRVYVADPDSKMIFSYQLQVSSDGRTLSTDGKQRIVASGAEARWVADDGHGGILFSDEARNEILQMPESRIMSGDESGDVLYRGSRNQEVSAPGGVTSDGSRVYWTNKLRGTTHGSIISAAETQHPGIHTRGELKMLSANAQKSYGICTSLSEIYYTAATNSVFGVSKQGGAPREVLHGLSRPRGCAYDGDGTVFVADPGQNAVFQFAGNMKNVTETEYTKAFDYDDAFGLAFYSQATSFGASKVGLVITLACSIFFQTL